MTLRTIGCSLLHEVFVVGTRLPLLRRAAKCRAVRKSRLSRCCGSATSCPTSRPKLCRRCCRASRWARYRPRQVIYLPGDRAQGIHFLAQGRIKISKVTRDGKELTLAYRTEGDFFGEPCLLDGGPREEMAEAMDASIDGRDRARAARRPAARPTARAAYKFARALISRRKDLETRVEQLIFKDVGAKLAELLLNLGPGARHRRTSAAPSSASRSRTRRWRT